MTGSLDDGPDALPPKGEFFTSQRCKFMPQIPGQSCLPSQKVNIGANIDRRYVSEKEDNTVALAERKLCLPITVVPFWSVG